MALSPTLDKILSVDTYSLEREGEEPVDYSVTELIKPPKIYWLSKRYEGFLYKDLRIKVKQCIGTGFHILTEKCLEINPDFIPPFRLRKEVAGKIVSGTFDAYNKKTRTLTDFKVTGVYKFMNLTTQNKLAYEFQLNTYALMLEEAGYPVDHLFIDMIFTNWNAREAVYKEGYPDFVEQIPIRKYDLLEASTILESAVKQQESFKDTPDDEIPVCSEEERWVSKSKYAVKKSGGKSAVRGGVFDSKEAAEQFMETYKNLKAGEELYIEDRPGESMRCKTCEVAQYCNINRQ